MVGLSELVRVAVLQWCPNSSTAAQVATAVAVAHIAVRNVRMARRRVLRPIRLLGRILRGLAGYGVVIGLGWLVLTTVVPHYT